MYQKGDFWLEFPKLEYWSQSPKYGSQSVPPNREKHSIFLIVLTEYIEKIHQSLLLIFLIPRSITGVLGSECKYRVFGPKPPEYKSFKVFCEPFDLSLPYIKNELPTAPVTFSSLEISTNVCKITIVAHCETSLYTFVKLILLPSPYIHYKSLNSIAIFVIFIKYQIENNERIQGITSSVYPLQMASALNLIVH